ncbi:cadherin-17 isoform 1 precursor [Homo sapiens]|uniref:Cadherin-17 n=2 Tax=Homo sapiens TaxID=9606 RepID=CAD17_HUMAN|nr:cadherin-17 isoform 1 precursor [Homo sapiens]NP_001400881.1 cadherin-17 isoform 1 precursor [Homo sapiens]NP_001400882.1 cadherin-17 isoform 1 precursor [Homo sapiens]NP_004054.3 cadherin-17 isoform 1 precursor [Homo sapiens]Q12864.3 RecName: Full=Cadherin-17; AltName: Full=Intestinal peptide-associated transporter HPT-1; AltName: Full=Liver-intestine cadherin; Short=LI-cadherin; Flags: Precursor [Homo sapiens]|eukprot:NP_001138135.1 cadherin-17 precursor [Homo sapiens]
MILQAHLHSLCLLMLYLATGYGQEGKFSGPLKPMTFSIYEGQEPSQIIFQFKANPPAVTFELTGETDNIFVIEREGLLYYNRALDRETRSTHNLQVAALDANGIIVEGPVPITIKVKDINDNRPTFLQSKYEGSVRQNSRPGKPFLYVNATDLDDPATPNGQLYYQIVIQLPMINNVMYFQINNKTGAISLTREGSQELNPAKNPSYNLVISVKDMGGQSENSFSDTTSVDIIVTENIWKAPKPVEMVENSTDPHPIKITQVRWNDPGAQYSLVDKEKLPRFPFSIDQEGDIYVTQPLDREEKDAYVFYAVAKDEYGKPLSYPLEIHVKVKDINDNPPTCPSPVTVFEVQENERLGNSIGTLTAHDRDEENTANSFLNYRIVEQTPKLPMDGLFLIQTYAGMLQLAKQSLKKQDTPQYNLTIEVSDKDFKTLCFVQINVIDINDQIPIFEKSDYGNLTLAEDTNIGSTILTIQATDADEPFTGSSKILYHIIKGDSEGRLGVDTDPHTNTGYVIIKKPLDFETAAVSNIVFKAENPEPLVFGVKYNASSFAKFTLIVTDVNEAPQFSQHVFQAKVSEDVAIGTKVGNVTAKDPEGLDISYSLRGDTRGWLKIDHVTGEIFSVAPLDREAGSPYRVQVVATEVGGSSLSSVSEFHLILMDVNDNPPRLAKDYTGLFFCHPLSAPGSLIFEATDDDQHLFRGPHFTFSLGSGSLQNDWEVSKINGTHARLSTRHTEFEEREYVVLIRINDGGRPPLEGIVSLPVTFCSCVEGSCFRPAGHQTGIPTVGMAVGILLTTLLVIGIILAVVFIRIKKDKGKDNVESAQASEVKPLRS